MLLYGIKNVHMNMEDYCRNYKQLPLRVKLGGRRGKSLLKITMCMY